MEKKLLKRFEEMDEKERSKLKELLTDSKTDGDAKLSWMYKDKADNEEYLLGRRIDTGIIQPEEITNADAAGALFSEVITRRSELDMQVKMREDPLYAIRKKEEEVKRRLLENPIKMKQLQKAVEEQNKKKSKHGDKKKKKKKHKKSHASSSSDDDDELLRKYLTIVGQKRSKDSTHRDEGKDIAKDSRARDGGKGVIRDSTCRERGKDILRDKRDRNGIKGVTMHSTRCDSGRDTARDSRDSYGRKDVRDGDSGSCITKERKDRYGGKGVIRDSTHRDGGSGITREKKDRDDGKDDAGENGVKERGKVGHKRHSKELCESDDEEQADLSSRRQYGLLVGNSRTLGRLTASSIELNKVQNVETNNQQTSVKTEEKSVPTKPVIKRKLTEAEMEQKRAEMLANARLRDEQRERNVKRYREEDEQERKLSADQRAAASFVKPLMMKHAAESSVEDRIKRNVYKCQRTNSQLDSSFTKR